MKRATFPRAYLIKELNALSQRVRTNELDILKQRMKIDFPKDGAIIDEIIARMTIGFSDFITLKTYKNFENDYWEPYEQTQKRRY